REVSHAPSKDLHSTRRQLEVLGVSCRSSEQQAHDGGNKTREHHGQNISQNRPSTANWKTPSILNSSPTQISRSPLLPVLLSVEAIASCAISRSGLPPFESLCLRVQSSSFFAG